MVNELKQLKEEIVKQINDKAVETQRHFAVLTEHFDSQVKLVAEQYGSIDKKLESHTEMFGSMKEDTGIIKMDIELIKNNLAQKVNRDEFAFLEKRVCMLEAKTK